MVTIQSVVSSTKGYSSVTTLSKEAGPQNSGIITLTDDSEIQIGNQRISFPAGARLRYVRGEVVAASIRPGSRRPSISVGSNNISFLSAEFDHLGEVLSLRSATDITSQNIRFFAGARIWFHSNGNVMAGHLEYDTVLSHRNQELLLKHRTRFELFPNGEVRGGTLAKPATIQGIDLHENDQVIFARDRRLRWLRLSTANAIPGSAVQNALPAGTIIEFRENATIEATLGEDAVVQGHRLLAGTRICFHANGRIERVFLNRDTAVRQGSQTLSFRGGTYLYLYENGSVRRGTLAAQTTIQQGSQNISFLGEHIEFFENGLVSNGTLAETTLQNIAFPARTRISFFPNGAIRNVVPGSSVTIQGFNFPAGTEVSFSLSGNLLRAELRNNSNFQGRFLPAATVIAFHGNGNWQVTLSQDTRIEYGSSLEQIFPRGSILGFRRNGTLIRSVLSRPVGFYIPSQPAGRTLSFIGSIYFYENGVLQSGRLESDTTIYVGQNFARFRDYIEFHENGTIMSGILAQEIRVRGRVCRENEEVEFSEQGRIRLSPLEEEIEASSH